MTGPHHVDEFRTLWAHYDREATGKLHYTKLIELLKELDPPLGLGGNCLTSTVQSVLMRLDAPMDKDNNVQVGSDHKIALTRPPSFNPFSVRLFARE